MAKISTLRKYRTDGTAGEAIYPKTVTSAIIDWDSSMISGDVDLSNTVQYTVQSKTNSEKLLARQNIDAVSSAEVSSVVYSAVNSSFATTSESINSRINSLESQLNTSIKLQVVPFGGLVNNPRVSYSYIQSTYYTDVVYDTARKQWL